jgi:hypothetical protein
LLLEYTNPINHSPNSLSLTICLQTPKPQLATIAIGVGSSKSSVSVDSGILDSEAAEFFEAEELSRPSTAFLSAEEDEASDATHFGAEARDATHFIENARDTTQFAAEAREATQFAAEAREATHYSAE